MSFAMIPGTELAQLGVGLAIVLLLAWPLGLYMARVFTDRPLPLLGWLRACERGIYRLGGIAPEQEMSWRTYAYCVLSFGLVNILVLYGILRFQDVLPLNPRGLPALSPDLAFNTAVSFATNTNWQSYSGEKIMSLFSQMAGLTVQNFISAATGMAVMISLIRAFTRKKNHTIGNFWADMVRSLLYVLLPLSLLWGVLLGVQGVPQTLEGSIEAQWLQKQAPEANEMQEIPLGLVASQVAIKQLGTNGGGYYNTNAAHPLENPTPATNLLLWIAILLVPAASCFCFGYMIDDRRQGMAILTIMTLIFLPLVMFALAAEQAGNPMLASLGIDQTAGYLEGKEWRFGTGGSVLWAVATTATSNGSVNAMHSSLLPLTGFVPLLLMQIGEVVYGGVGSGLYGMMMYVLLAVFVAGLMVGRTPEYLGKKIGVFEVKMLGLFILIPAFWVLVGTGIAVLTGEAHAAILNTGPHGFTEILYAVTSAANNNGSAFAGFNANTPLMNSKLGIAILFGRYGIIIPVLALAGALAEKNTVPPSAGTLPTHTPLFVMVVVAVVLLVEVLTYVPSLAMGPLAEHVMLIQSN